MSILQAASMPRSGGGAPAASIDDRTISRIGTGTGVLTSKYTLDDDGNVRGFGIGSLETWLDSGVNSDFECRATHMSGSTPAGTLGTWLPLDELQTWSISAGAGSFRSCTIKVEIRLAALPNTVLDDATIQLIADNTANPGT